MRKLTYKLAESSEQRTAEKKNNKTSQKTLYEFRQSLLSNFVVLFILFVSFFVLPLMRIFC
jgi:hypothetical protein